MPVGFEWKWMIKMKKMIISMGKKLVYEKMVTRSWGNLSWRNGRKMVITPSGSNYENLQENDLVEVDLDTGNFNPSLGKP